MTNQELYDKAKEAYYNGDEIMTDLEFDELEKALGLENQGYVGTHHQKSYTIPHPFIMGSLSKVQIKENDDHTIDWGGYQEKVLTYLRKSRGYMKHPDWGFESTPKYDGCSWELTVNKKGEMSFVSTRGDGEYGKDITVWFEPEWEKNFKEQVKDYFKSLDEDSYFFLDKLVIRGECLVKRSVFDNKYSKEFTMPRSFVAGCLGQDWEGTGKQKEMREDLSWVCYDYREVYENGVIVEIDYTGKDRIMSQRNLPGIKADNVITGTLLNIESLYHTYEEYRRNCEFALDGFVIKPLASFRLQDGSRARQQDCVAVKFLPEIADATLIDIEWNVGKTGEYYPTGILEPVILGGKSVNRVSLHNYGYVKENGLGDGAKLRISLAGDIIPFVYEIVEEGAYFDCHLENTWVKDDVHLMKIMSMEEKSYIRLINSVKVLKPDGIGEAVATKLFELHKYDNIVSYMIGIDELRNELDDSKSSQNIINALVERKKTLNLPDLIQSMGYENCGSVNALWLAKKWSGLNPDTKGIPTTIIELGETKAFNEDVSMLVLALGLEPMKEEKVEDKIPIIMTGSPKECGFNTKADFLAKHPEYAETSKWGECKILFTDDLNSTSSKMEKAKKLGIEIKVYE